MPEWRAVAFGSTIRTFGARRIDGANMVMQQNRLAEPFLSDGTPISTLFDLDKREVSLRLFSDESVFELEQEYLFARAWNLLAHESELPNPGDFVTRSIGLDAVIVVRGQDGSISVLLNVCTHRGMSVCRSDLGNTGTFKCPYHGWVFGQDGSMLAAPLEKDFYSEGLDKGSLGLQRARVELYAGFVFANWDPDAPPFDDFLGPFKFYLDPIFDSTDAGLEVVGQPQRFVIRGNWKTASEQFNGADGYHAATLHRSLFEAMSSAFGMSGDDLDVNLASVLHGLDISSDEGHGMRCFGPGDYEAVRYLGVDALIEQLKGGLDAMGMRAIPDELVPEFANHLSVGQLRMMVSNGPGVGGIFPNVGFLGMNIRVHVPLDPNHFVMTNWAMVPKAASAERKAMIRKQQLAQFGTSGTVEQDDAESWPSIQRSSRGWMGRQHSMKYQALLGEQKPDGWEGGAHVHEGLSKDDSGWRFWLRYRDYMTGQAW